MKRYTDVNGVPHVEFDGLEEITRDAVGVIVADLFGPNETSTISVPVLDPRAVPCGLTLGQMQDFITTITDLSGSLARGSREGWETFTQISDAVGELSSVLESMIDEARA